MQTQPTYRTHFLTLSKITTLLSYLLYHHSHHQLQYSQFPQHTHLLPHHYYLRILYLSNFNFHILDIQFVTNTVQIKIWSILMQNFPIFAYPETIHHTIHFHAAHKYKKISLLKFQILYQIIKYLFASQ